MEAEEEEEEEEEEVEERVPTPEIMKREEEELDTDQVYNIFLYFIVYPSLKTNCRIHN